MPSFCKEKYRVMEILESLLINKTARHKVNRTLTAYYEELREIISINNLSLRQRLIIMLRDEYLHKFGPKDSELECFLGCVIITEAKELLQQIYKEQKKVKHALSALP